MKWLLIALAVMVGTIVSSVSATPAPVEAAIEQPAPEIRVYENGELLRPSPDGTTWYGNFYTCYREGDYNSARMHCYTRSTFDPRLYYQVVPTFRNRQTGYTKQVWGSKQSIDGHSWGAWSNAYSPYASSTLASLSYWITW